MPSAVTDSAAPAPLTTLPPEKSVIGFITRGNFRTYATIASRDSKHEKLEVSGRDLDAVKFRVNQGILYLMSAYLPEGLLDALKAELRAKYGVIVARTDMSLQED